LLITTSLLLPSLPSFSQEAFSEELSLPLRVMPGQEEGAGQTYVVLARPPGSLAYGSFLATLRFRVKEIDPTTGGLAALLLGLLGLLLGLP
jgi:hypothetical protein